jgi:hypothetical protein
MKLNPGSTKTDNIKINSTRSGYTGSRWRSWRIHMYVYMIIGLILFLGSCGTAQVAGIWNTSGKVSVTGQTITATGADPAEIRGFMTIQEILAAYSVTWEEFYKKFNLPPETALSSPLNTLEKISPDFSVTKLKAWLTERPK